MAAAAATVVTADTAETEIRALPAVAAAAATAETVAPVQRVAHMVVAVVAAAMAAKAVTHTLMQAAVAAATAKPETEQMAAVRPYPKKRESRRAAVAYTTTPIAAAAAGRASASSSTWYRRQKMKVFQIFGGFCHWDATKKHPTLADTVDKYAPDILFVETPDYVFEGWGYDSTASGDARFVKPTPPEGWAYDDDTGTFYPTDPEIVESLKSPEQKALEILGVEVEADETD